MSSLLKSLLGFNEEDKTKVDLESRAGSDSLPNLPRRRYECPPGRKRIISEQDVRRTWLDPAGISLWGWPSRGGVIVLEDPRLPDFEFLALKHLDPPMHRDADQSAEDLFCRQLLRLGATWWESESRRWFVLKSLPQCDENSVHEIDSGRQMLPTRRERRWMRVAWPSNAPGTLWVAEFDTMVMGEPEDENERMLPEDAGRIALANTMNERRDLIQRLGGKVYASTVDYDGEAFLRAWEDEKQEGKADPLAMTG